MIDPMTTTVVVIFVIVYLGMLLGGLPCLQLDRTGVALLGAIALVPTGDLTPEQAVQSIPLPTLLLLLSFMVISAQMRLGRYYTWVTLRNLLIVGSIANIIVVDAARRNAIVIDWKRHARTGVPVTLLTLSITAGWLAFRIGN